MATRELRVAPRKILGKRVKILRRSGSIPGNVIGRGVASTAIQMDEREVERLLAHTSPSTLIALVGLDGAPRSALVKRVTRIPTTGRLEHVDFYQVSEQQRVQTDVPLHFTGTSDAVTRHDGIMLHALTHVRVECLPRDLPQAIEVSVDALSDFDQAIHVRDLAVPTGVTVLTDAGELVAKVVPPQKEAEAPAPAPEQPSAAAPETEAPS